MKMNMSNRPGSTITIQFSKGGFMQLHENTDPVFTIIRETMCLLIQMFYGDAILDTGGQCVNMIHRIECVYPYKNTYQNRKWLYNL
jgi:hypothetical protein